MRFYIYSFFLFFLFFCCCNKKNDVILPSELANKKWYKAEIFDGEYRIPDDKAYYSIITGESEINIITSEYGTSNTFDIVHIDTLLGSDGYEYYEIELEGEIKIADRYSYKVVPIDKQKNLYHWVYYYNGNEWADNQYFTFFAIASDGVGEKAFFANKFPLEFEKKNFYFAEFIYPYYYIVSDTFRVQTGDMEIRHNNKRYLIHHIDSTQSGINITIDDTERYAFGMTRVRDRVYSGMLKYDDKNNKRQILKVDYLVESSIVKPLLFEIPDYSYETSVEYVKKLPPIYKQQAIDVTNQYASDKLHLTNAKKIYNIDSYIQYKYPDAEVVCRSDVYSYTDNTEDDIAIIISEEVNDGSGENSTDFTFLFFHKVPKQQDTYIVYCEITLDVSAIEIPGEFYIGNTEEHFYISYIVDSEDKEYIWKVSPKSDDLWIYEGTQNTKSSLKENTSLENTDYISFY